jgi:uncharacterized protein (DUF983 family)
MKQYLHVNSVALRRMFTCVCPYCKQETGVGMAALFDTALMSRKTCEKCGGEFLIVNDVQIKEEQYKQESQG